MRLEDLQPRCAGRGVFPAHALIEALLGMLGGPLQHQTSGSRREVVENPTEAQLRMPHAELMGNKIMLFHRREKLVFETDWLPSDSVSDFARSIAQSGLRRQVGRDARAGAGRAGEPLAGEIQDSARSQYRIDLQGYRRARRAGGG